MLTVGAVLSLAVGNTISIENYTNILVIKQLTYVAGLNKKLRFGKCCL